MLLKNIQKLDNKIVSEKKLYRLYFYNDRINYRNNNDNTHSFDFKNNVKIKVYCENNIIF